MEKIKTAVNMALNDKDAGIQPNEINSILLVGGGSRMPMIKNLLQNIFPNAEQRIEINPDEAVAKGAAYYACHLLSNMELNDQILAESNSGKEKLKTYSNFRPFCKKSIKLLLRIP
jgi:molecular chaperone DnaK